MQGIGAEHGRMYDRTKMAGQTFGRATISAPRNGRCQCGTCQNRSLVSSMLNWWQWLWNKTIMWKIIFICRSFLAIILSIITIKSLVKPLPDHTVIIAPESFGALFKHRMCASTATFAFITNVSRALSACAHMSSLPNAKNHWTKYAPRTDSPFKRTNVPSATLL